MPVLRAFWIAGLLFLSSALTAAEPNTPEDRQVISLLAGRCLECHGPNDSAGGLDLTSQAGLQKGSDSGAVLAESWDSSILWRVISSEEMPPKGKLSDREKEVLKNWVSRGAKLPAEPIDRLGISSDYRAGYDWWSLRELSKTSPPIPVGQPRADLAGGWRVRNLIDSYVLDKLQGHGLEPNPEASPRSVLRRVFDDLIGLPPTFEQLQAFEQNPSDEAYGAIVDELLRSPAYGERWARHWLDVVRFGESDGFERNYPRLNSWHYRDWVIRALNDDMPYDRFVQMQIAGDQSEPNSSGYSAAGFLVSGVHNTVVGSSDRMKRIALQDELEEKIGTMSQAFLGLTAQCARCHEHKFDPISSESYYRLAASIQGASHGEREIIDEDHQRIERGLELERAKTLSQLRGLEQQALQTATKTATSIPLPVAAWNFEVQSKGDSNERIFYDTVRGLVGRWNGSPQGRLASLSGGGLVLDGNSYLETEPIDFGVQEKTLTAWVKIDPLEQSGGGVISLQSLDGVAFDAIVYGERDPGQWMSGSNGFARSAPFGGQRESSQRVHIAIRYKADGTIEAFRNGELYGKGYRTGFQSFEAGKSQFLLGLRHGPAGGNRWLSGVIYKAACFDTALEDEAIATLASQPQAEWNLEEAWKKLGESFIQQRQEHRTELERIDRELRDVRAQVRKKIYSVVSNPSIGPTKVLLRGDVYKEGAQVRAGGIDTIGGPKGDFGLAPEASDGQRRLALAQWITQANRSLVARVIVNRLWHYHFGVGIVDTPNDFGFNGARPTHPELLDALASAFLEGGMTLKSLHRLIVTSSVYRQSTQPREDGISKDASNRLLWRYPVRRLDGESARDSMLQVAGVLDRTTGGPGYVDVDYKDTNGTTYYFPKPQEPAECFRRTVYRFNPRCERVSMLDVLDCPDPSATAPKRALTTTPLQALSLLNSSFVFQMSDALVDRLGKQQDSSWAITAMFRSVLLRDATPEELAQARVLVDKHGLRALARALWNSNEFLVLD
jgi:cytochrome c553